MNESTLALLRTRRSVKPDLMTEPGPTPVQLEEILTIAARVPDHKKLVPWRFIVFTGDARSSFGERIAKACQAEDTMPPSNVRLEAERNRFLRAPVVVAVISRVEAKPGAPEWEQILSAGAAAMNLCIAANAMGFVTNWLTEWIAYSPLIRQDLKLAENERVVGFIYIGSSTTKPDERPRPALGDVVTHWQG
ncbi:MAG: nitroreductase [Hyphomicrobiaceae bacterium]|nr:nitroreductase [Hyphomicrobiaceae bacterium]MCC0010580.1 nitroreductase [Hyphomicrobiaceae bacterium]